MNRRYEITDGEWERLAALLPTMTPKRGGRWRDHRQVLNGILFRVRTGIPWRDLPERYGPWQTVDKRFARWQADGTWTRIQACLHTAADAAGGLDWHGQIDASVVRAHQHAAGAPKGAGIRPGGRAAGARPLAWWADHQVAHHLRRPRPEPSHPAHPGASRRYLPADRVGRRRAGGPARRAWPAADAPGAPDRRQGYSSRANRQALRARRIRHTIPERDDQKANRARRGARGGRPPAFDRDRYRQRNQAKRLMNRRKQFRAVATRFDKLACRYQATVIIADIFIWLRARPDRPRGDPRNTP